MGNSRILKPTDQENEVMTVRQVAELLQLSEHQVYRLANCKEIPAKKLGGSWRFLRSHILKFLED